MTCESKGHNAKLLTFKEISIDLNILLPFFRSSRLFKDSRDGARRLTRATVYAFIGIDVKHLNRFKLLLVLCRMDGDDFSHAQYSVLQGQCQFFRAVLA